MAKIQYVRPTAGFNYFAVVCLVLIPSYSSALRSTPGLGIMDT